VRFTDPGGSITVSCRAADDTVLLSVADTGIGIPPDQLEAIFEPFVQLDSGLTRRAGGTGLGLAISRELVTAMGGRITVASIPDMGSTFTIELPRVVMAGHAMRSPEPVRAKDGR
ncbi:MAG TPA: ATP-binding protein, partial [Gemmatimonadaceae bacterium]|nr:ATP-binding protein [Gemmatimonadaceae bacterium]